MHLAWSLAATEQLVAAVNVRCEKLGQSADILNAERLVFPPSELAQLDALTARHDERAIRVRVALLQVWGERECETFGLALFG
jgi:hypothetical protein